MVVEEVEDRPQQVGAVPAVETVRFGGGEDVGEEAGGEAEVDVGGDARGGPPAGGKDAERLADPPFDPPGGNDQHLGRERVGGDVGQHLGQPPTSASAVSPR
jgi:hypothetical protein